MKKIVLSLVIISSLFIGLNSTSKTTFAQDGVSTEAGANIIIGLIEDQLIEESTQEVANILKDLRDAAKEAGATRSVDRLLSTINRNTNALLKAAQHLPLERCKHQISEAKIQQTINLINKLNSMLCSNVNAARGVYFYPMAKHCTSIYDLKCVCSHPSHRKAPKCAAFVNEEPKCLSDDDFAASLGRTAEIYDDDIIQITEDDDGDGIPNICENNKKRK